MKFFFDKIYFGCYYLYLLTNKSDTILVYPFVYIIAWLFSRIPYVKKKFEEQGKTWDQSLKESLSSTKQYFDNENYGMGHFWTGGILGPMVALFWGDLLILIYTVFGEDIGFYKFNKETGWYTTIFIVAAIFISFCFAFGGDERNRKIVKRYRRKPKSEQRKAFALFCFIYIFVFAVFLALCAYNIRYADK